MKISIRLDSGDVITIPFSDFQRGGRINGVYRVVSKDGREGVWITKAEAAELNNTDAPEIENE